MIALMTDFGEGSIFVGIMKGVINRLNPRAKIVDLSHDIPHFNTESALFLLEKSYRYFPKGTIFLVVVDPGVGGIRRPIAIESRDYSFVGPDNGLFSFLRDEDILSIVELKQNRFFLPRVSNTFHGRDIFAPIAAHLSMGVDICSLGRRIRTIKRIRIPKPVRRRNILKGQIVYIDRFGNLVTNIQKEDFEKFTKRRRFKIELFSGRAMLPHKITKISSSYDMLARNIIGIFDSFDCLEIAIPRAAASQVLRLKPADKIVIERLDKAGK